MPTQQPVLRIPVELFFANVVEHPNTSPSNMRVLRQENHSGSTIFLIPPGDVSTSRDAITIQGFGRLKAKTPVPQRIEFAEVFVGTDGDFTSESENFWVEFVAPASVLATGAR
jgi:hypothetical protein